MATRSCPKCGTQYVATVRRCIDCDANLVDDVAPAAGEEPVRSSAKPASSGKEVGYELEGWGNQLKVTLEGMLDRAGIPRAWEAGALLVPAAHEGAVDDLIATLEGGELTDLDDDTPMVALEIEGLDPAGADELDARLIGSGVAHAWDDDGALIVAEADEDEVLAIVEAVLEGVDDEEDPMAAQQTLTQLYVALDRLLKRPTDPKLVAAYTDAAEPLPDLAVPYGFAASEWKALVDDAADLLRTLNGDDDGDGERPGAVGDDANDPAGDAERVDDADDEGVGDDDGASDALADRIRDLRGRLSDLV